MKGRGLSCSWLKDSASPALGTFLEKVDLRGIFGILVPIPEVGDGGVLGDVLGISLRVEMFSGVMMMGVGFVGELSLFFFSVIVPRGDAGVVTLIEPRGEVGLVGVATVVVWGEVGLVVVVLVVVLAERGEVSSGTCSRRWLRNEGTKLAINCPNFAKFRV